MQKQGAYQSKNCGIVHDYVPVVGGAMSLVGGVLRKLYELWEVLLVVCAFTEEVHERCAP